LRVFSPELQDIHYTVDEKQRNVLLTEDGYEAVEDVLQVR
jgi:preprotein translocase subunit SecA